MISKELKSKNPRKLCVFLKTVRQLTRDINKTIRRCGYPKPDGFRVRISAGDVYKIKVVDPNDTSRKRLIPEYIEYATNQAAHLLKVNPEIPCLSTEIVGRILGRFRPVFRMRKLEKPSTYPESVHKLDIDGLQILHF